jgi:hypothetical protein
VNVLADPTLTVGEIVDEGARRIGVGGALTWVAAKAFVDATVAMRDEGGSLRPRRATPAARAAQPKSN